MLAQPPSRGFSLLVWLVPVLAVLLGIFLFIRYLNNLRASADDDEDDTAMIAQSTAIEPPPAADPDDYHSRVEEEVREE